MKILDLCGGSGSWSKPYVEGGYDVIVVTLPQDVRLFRHPGKVHGILCAPPCTVFASSGARWPRTEAQMIDSLSVVDACLRLVLTCKPEWWCLENPVGTLRRWIGPPVCTFQPCDYGDPWTKRTCLWGDFVLPPKRPVTPVLGSIMYTAYGGKTKNTKYKRSITPPGFARAFYESNR